MIVGALIVAALVTVVIFSLSGGSEGLLGNIVGGDTPRTPSFAFDVGKPKPIETATKPNPQQAVAQAQAPAEAVTQQLDDLYTAAFLDPGNWMDGRYDDVLDLFVGGARGAARKQLDVLTAGPDAGESFDSIGPMQSTLKLLVLFDPQGVARSVEGSVRFAARGTGGQGQVKLVSRGQFIFEKSEGEWLVVSFSIRRGDEEREPKPSGSSSPSAQQSASVEPSEAGSP